MVGMSSACFQVDEQREQNYRFGRKRGWVLMEKYYGFKVKFRMNEQIIWLAVSGCPNAHARP
jgi:hypothetical protein